MVNPYLSPEEVFNLALDKLIEAYRRGPSSIDVTAAQFALRETYLLVTDPDKGGGRF